MIKIFKKRRKRLTNKQIIALCQKYREEIMAEFEQHICLEHYNLSHRTELEEKDVEFKDCKCSFCDSQKCIVIKDKSGS